MSNGPYLIDVFVPDHSHGLMVDARVICSVLGDEQVRLVSVPTTPASVEKLRNEPAARHEVMADTAIFVERLFDNDYHQEYPRRVLLANPEWLNDQDVERAHFMVDEIWHKSRASEIMLTKLFPEKIHRYIGFSSLPVPAEVENYEGFLHFAGRSQTRHSQDIVDIWLNDESLPKLRMQAYGAHVEIPRWLDVGGFEVFLGFMPEVQYFSEMKRSGIHLCTSQMEGFGHYINESRALGALVITLDAPPMNELVDAASGILVPVQRSESHCCGTRFFAAPVDIRQAIDKAIAMTHGERAALGAAARNRYICEKDIFAQLLREAVMMV